MEREPEPSPDGCLQSGCEATATHWLGRPDRVYYAMCEPHAIELAERYPETYDSVEPMSEAKS